MAKTSLAIQQMSRAAEQHNPGFNYLPTAGQAYPNGQTAYQIMLASADSIGIWVEVEYLDENGNTQKRRLGKGIWPIITTQINGYRSVQDLEGDLNAEVSADGLEFEISVLI